MPKIIQCKNCGSPLEKGAKFCRNCGAVQKRSRKGIIIAVIVVVVIVIIIAASSGDEPEKVGEISQTTPPVSSTTPTPEAEPTPTSTPAPTSSEFGVGDIVELNGVNVTLLSVTESNGSEFFRPSEGHVFLLCEFEIENNSSEEIAVSSLLSFDAYIDDYSANVDVSAMASTNETQLDGTVASGKKMRGIIGYQAPNDWGEIEVRFITNVWSSDEVIFTHSK